MLGGLGKTRVLVNAGSVADGDSIAAYLTDAAGDLLTSTLNGSDQSLDVNITNTSAISVALSEGVYDEDAAHTSGDKGFAVWGVRNDAGTALAGTDGDYIPFSMDASGNLRVSGTFTSAAGKAEDAAHSSGDSGSYVLSVRKDAAGSGVDADGDYASFQQTKDGYLRAIGMAEQAILQAKVSVGLTATQIPATNLANRKHITIQNISAGLVYIGSATVTTSGATTGLVLARGGTYQADVSDAIDVYGITAGAAKDVICVELS